MSGKWLKPAQCFTYYADSDQNLSLLWGAYKIRWELLPSIDRANTQLVYYNVSSLSGAGRTASQCSTQLQFSSYLHSANESAICQYIKGFGVHHIHWHLAFWLHKYPTFFHVLHSLDPHFWQKRVWHLTIQVVQRLVLIFRAKVDNRVLLNRLDFVIHLELPTILGTTQHFALHWCKIKTCCLNMLLAARRFKCLARYLEENSFHEPPKPSASFRNAFHIQQSSNVCQSNSKSSHFAECH